MLDYIITRSSNYSWIWSACQNSPTPVQTYAELRAAVDNEQPYFFGQLSNGIRFAGDARDFPAALHAINPKSNSTLIDEILRKISDKEGDVIDVGANIGVVCASIARHMGEKGHVYAFEPSPETFCVAAATIALNEVNNVTLIQAAVSNQVGSTKFFATPGNSAISSLRLHEFSFLNSWQTIEASVCTLDSFFEEKEFNPIVIKIDVEGSELAVIQGSTNLISKHLPLIIYEYTPVAANSHGWTEEDSILSLEKNGSFCFSALIEESDGQYTSFPLPENLQSQVNVFATPASKKLYW